MSDDFAKELLDRAASLRAEARALVLAAGRARSNSGLARNAAEEIARDTADHQLIQDLMSKRRREPLELSAEVEAILRRAMTRTPSAPQAGPGSPQLSPSPTEPDAPMAELVGARQRRAGPATDDLDRRRADRDAPRP